MRTLFISLVLLLPLFSVAQSRIITNESDTILIKNYTVWGEELSYLNINTDRQESIQIVNIQQFDGDLFRRQQKIFKKVNPDLKINEGLMDLEMHRIKKFDTMYSAGDHLMKAGKSYQTATALYILGGGTVLSGALLENNGLGIAGGGLCLTGLVFQIIGHSHLVKSGYKLNKQGLTLKAAESGTGLALVF
ncbi:hypothetical protein [uncultured Sunxiuqinia sp.]|uniref:hypothetical protein n=1 Tax=uncultured Sunxiuqinia sp. TaxID=1573825 RepID=UPI00263334A4|nr:hypothetical protein [uncultured Sunxiuqinia sp.]